MAFLTMSDLFRNIQNAVEDERFIVGDHAFDRLQERRISIWQVIEGLHHAKLIKERPDDTPNPIIEADQILADATPIKAVWSYLRRSDTAKLVTIHFFDR